MISLWTNFFRVIKNNPPLYSLNQLGKEYFLTLIFQKCRDLPTITRSDCRLAFKSFCFTGFTGKNKKFQTLFKLVFYASILWTAKLKNFKQEQITVYLVI